MKICSACGQELLLSAFSKHSGHRDGLQSHCKRCKAESDRKYQAQHKEQKATYDRERRAMETDDERDRRNQRRRELYAMNSELRRASNCKWKREHPEAVVLQTQRRRARIIGAQGEFTQEDWEYIKGMFDNKCAYCGEEKPLTRDHVFALARGGLHDKFNIAPACINCNAQKHTARWPIMTRKRGVVDYYWQTMDEAIAFAASVS